jgi:hypothetical protein
MQHFAQAKDTPFALYNRTYNFAHSINAECQDIKTNQIMVLFNKTIHNVENTDASNTISEEEGKQRLSKWREKALMPPSRMHLGHYKSQYKPHQYTYEEDSRNKEKLNKQQQLITALQLQLINIIITSQNTNKRWQTVHSILLFT